MPDSNLADTAVLTSTFYNTYLREQVVVTCTSSTRPSAVHGRFCYETDTGNLMRANSTPAWVVYSQPNTAFTPSWTNLTAGNGTGTSYYSVSAGLMSVNINLTFGSTTSVSGTVSFTLPASQTSDARTYGTALYTDVSATNDLGAMVVSTGSSNCSFVTSSTSNVNATTPFTWTTSDKLRGSIVLPVSS